jgi:hypothetical protein
MKRIVLFAMFIVIAGASLASAQTAPGAGNTAAPRVGAAFVDANGDGICDNFQNGTPRRQGMQGGRRGGYGPGDGTGNQGMGPRDGTGYGPGAGAGNGTGNCDGTGPKGRGFRGGRQ